MNLINEGMSLYQTVSSLLLNTMLTSTCMRFTKKLGCVNQLFWILKKGNIVPQKAMYNIQIQCRNVSHWSEKVVLSLKKKKKKMYEPSIARPRTDIATIFL